MKVLNHSQNLNPLKNAMGKAEKEILISSAWIRGEVLRKLIPKEIRKKIKKGEISLKIIIRIGDRKDIEISGVDLFQFASELGEHCQLRYHQTLHTKMYIVDNSYGLIGSFNLTGGGFGTEEQPGRNIESGIEVTSSAEIQALKQQFYDIWDNEALKIEKQLIGFVLSMSSEREFYVIGIRPLESGMFVTVKGHQNGREEFILGQISEVLQMNPLFYSFPSDDADWDENMFNAFSNSNDFVNLMAGIAEKQIGFGRNIHFGKVNIKSRINISEKGEISTQNNRFAPSVASEVTIARKELLENLYANEICKPAVLLSNEEVEAGLDPEKILRMHMAVFGSTGSGKSYFIKQMIMNYLKPWVEKEKGRIIILDPHGEYAHLEEFEKFIPSQNIIPDSADKSIKTLETKVIEEVDELIDVCNLGKLSRKQRDYLQEAMRKAKGSTENFVNILRADIDEISKGGGIEIDWMNYYREQFERIYPHEITPLKKIASILADLDKDDKDKRLKAIREDEKLNELFELLPDSEKNKIKNAILKNYLKDFEKQFSQKVEPVLSDEIVETIIHFANKKLFRLEPYNFIKKVEKPGIYCIDMRTIHDENQRLALASDILRGAFNKAKDAVNNPFKTLFVVEEAHNFAPEQSSKNNPAYKYMVKIAREGRKFGVGLLIISQRPAYVSKDVLAQCNTQAIFRLINPNDLKAVEATVEGISQEEIYKLPNYQTGQCIFTGIAIKEPVVVKIKKVRN